MKKTSFAQITAIIFPCFFSFFLLFVIIDRVLASSGDGQGQSSITGLLSASAERSNLTSPLFQVNPAMTVTLQARSGASIEFQTNNGNPPSDIKDLPHLILFENGIQTPEHCEQAKFCAR